MAPGAAQAIRHPATGGGAARRTSVRESASTELYGAKIVWRGIVGIALAAGMLAAGCNTDSKTERFDFSKDSPDISESEQLQSDFFTCKSYDEENETFAEVTDIFGPTDEILMAVAKLAYDEKRTNVVFEFDAPDGRLVQQEIRRYRSGSIVAIKFSVPKLIRDGGYGPWRINFYGDTLPIGYADFYILEEPEKGIPEAEAPLDTGPQGSYLLK